MNNNVLKLHLILFDIDMFKLKWSLTISIILNHTPFF